MEQLVSGYASALEMLVPWCFKYGDAAAMSGQWVLLNGRLTFPSDSAARFSETDSVKAGENKEARRLISNETHAS